MGLHHLLLVVFVFSFGVQIEAVPKSLDATKTLTDDHIHNPTMRLLRGQAESVERTETLSNKVEEERFGVKDAATMLSKGAKLVSNSAKLLSKIAKLLSKGVEMKVKMKYWLFRGITPENILDKLKVTSATDKNYKYFSKYFFNYYGKNPNARPSDLPPHTTHDITMTRLKNWLKQSRTPPQVFTDLGCTKTVASALDQQKLAYYQLYEAMWKALQVKLSEGPGDLKILRPGP